MRTRTWAALAAGAVAFAGLATANAGGYRYGVSDQAFYLPAIAKAIDPALFPRDAALLETQTHLLLADDALAAAAGLFGLRLPELAALLYGLTVVVFFAAAVALARRLAFSWWAVAAFGLLLTLRHRITGTGANSFEGYAHPRVLAFGLGVAACAGVLAGRSGLAWTAVALAAAAHPTTALWFGLVAAAATVARRRPSGLAIALSGAAALATAVWALTLGPLAGRLTVMDAEWLAALGDRDYLFADDWPLSTWLVNAGYIALLAAVFRSRRRRGLAGPAEAALGGGLLALAGVFLASLPFTAMRVALSVQLQVNRVFWLLDFAAAACLAWWLVEAAGRRWRLGPAAVVALLAAASIARGYYIIRVESDRPLIQATLPDTPWTEVMAWLASRPADWHVLADPEHAWKHGAGVRIAALRDTLVDASKDGAMAIYDRGIARRVAERLAAAGAFDTISAERLEALARTYRLDVAVVARPLRFERPVLFQNDGFVVYDLR